MSRRAGISPLPIVHHCRHLHSRFSIRVFLKVGNHYVIRHCAALHKHPSLRIKDMQYAHERFCGAFNNLKDVSLSPGSFRLLPCDGNFHPVSVQGPSKFVCPDEYIIFLSFDNYECKSLPCHLHGAFKNRQLFLFTGPACPVSLFSRHFTYKIAIFAVQIYEIIITYILWKEKYF